ncbi:hypothetical protein [Rhodococcus sp. NPDC127528]|uniref:hypothetical protein n=1 Tax=unclassified Rhodococcus (in: high G+C Gram-positive bacteria) TaxID=192944 RepID=UPI00362DC274
MRCERGQNAAGAFTIDSVRLEGNVDTAWKAFRVDSERFPDNVCSEKYGSDFITTTDADIR